MSPKKKAVQEEASCPINDPITDPERYPGDLLQPDTRRFELVLAIATGVLANSANISPAVLATRVTEYADAILEKLDAPEEPSDPDSDI